MKNVAELRQAGYKVKVLNKRYVTDVNGETWVRSKFEYHPNDKILAKGGYIEVKVVSPPMVKFPFGMSRCSIKDAFNHRTIELN